MKDEEIIKILDIFYKTLSTILPRLDSKFRDVYVDLWELYNDLIFVDENINSKTPNYPNQIIFYNILDLIEQIIEFSKEKDFDKIQNCLINLDIKLEHSQNHIKMARKSLKSIINQVSKLLPDEEK